MLVVLDTIEKTLTKITRDVSSLVIWDHVYTPTRRGTDYSVWSPSKTSEGSGDPMFVSVQLT